MASTLPRGLVRTAEAVSALLLFCIMALTSVDVVLRYVFNSPIQGAFELTEFAMAGVIFAAMPLVTLRRENVVIDVLDGSMSKQTSQRLDTIAFVIASVSSAFLAWRLAALAISLAQAGETTATLYVPVFPAAWFMATMAAINAAICAILFVRGLRRQGEVNA